MCTVYTAPKRNFDPRPIAKKCNSMVAFLSFRLTQGIYSRFKDLLAVHVKKAYGGDW